MSDFQEATAAFQSRHGADWYLFLNSPLWRAARALVAEFSPSRKLPSAASPADMVAFGVVFAANDQGYFDCLQSLERLAAIPGSAIDPTLNPSYLPDEPVVAMRPPPAPEVPPAPPAPRPAPRHRKAAPSPKPTTPKR